ncbi:glycosyltransferase family 39 protein [Flammeovirga sp. EKP202]|uniref:ArnT family glycosyltransferase n=1 Tax=Flammeovirga sp. EKP202 TaxID=2770592 RepID=UPI00165F7A90|nr:glycosyltransferase family 39 protein [Flammeovirga sp. EKP202]MBD0403029.1 glycosyltransferase family 39 protein [Flammeovirga sp. EKP202]
MKKNEILILLGFILLKFFFQSFLIDSIYDLQRDEFLHLDQANHLALGFTSVPPVTSWISSIIQIFGNGEFWVKFFPTLFGALTVVVVWLAIDELKGSLYAKVLGATCILFSCLLRLNTLYQPNSFDVLSWTVVFFLFIKYINTDQRKWIYWMAVAFAFGFLNKYNILFLVLGVIPAVLITKSRDILLRKEVYIAMGITLIIISPNIYWQFTNGFPVFHHMQELASSQLVNVERISFLKSQLFFFTGSFFVILGALIGLLFSKRLSKFKFLFWSLIFTLTLYTYLRAKDYYAIGLYPIYIAIGAVYLSHLLENKLGKIIKPILVVLPILIIILSFDFAFPNQKPEYIIEHKEEYESLGLLRWEDGKNHHIPQDYADMLGWSELASKVDKAYKKINSPDQVLVLCDNYGQAGAINYYTQNAIKAVSFDADYVNWFDLEKEYTHLIRVKNRREKQNELKETSPYFETSMEYDSITNPYAREFGTTIFIFESSKIDINSRIKEELNNIKNNKEG